MTLAEYCIQSFAYQRRELEQVKKIRLLAYANFLSAWQSKKTPPVIDKYWPLDDKAEKPNNDKLKADFLKRTEKFFLNKKDNGS